MDADQKKYLDRLHADGKIKATPIGEEEAWLYLAARFSLKPPAARQVFRDWMNTRET